VQNIIACASSAVITGTILAYANQTPGIWPIALASSICFFTFIAIALLYQEFRSQAERSEEADEFMKSLARVSYYNSSGIPLAGSIRRAALSSSKRVSRILRHTAGRVEAGETVFNAISGATGGDEKLSLCLGEYIKEGDKSIDEAVALYYAGRKERSSVRSSMMARYSTYNMFISTVAPSFIIFSFIGSMLIAQGSTASGLMSIALISGIPISYSLVSLVSSRGLFG
jgi:hypothetical protein